MSVVSGDSEIDRLHASVLPPAEQHKPVATTELIIKQEYLPTRCEICHHTDEFDAETNFCRRCVNGKPLQTSEGDALYKKLQTKLQQVFLDRETANNLDNLRSKFIIEFVKITIIYLTKKTPLAGILTKYDIKECFLKLESVELMNFAKFIFQDLNFSVSLQKAELAQWYECNLKPVESEYIKLCATWLGKFRFRIGKLSGKLKQLRQDYEHKTKTLEENGALYCQVYEEMSREQAFEAWTIPISELAKKLDDWIVGLWR